MLNELIQLRNTTEDKRSTKSTPNNYKMAIGTYILIITLNVNELNAPTKRHRLADWIKKTRPIYMLSTRNPLQTSRHIQTESERMEKYISCKWEAKESWSSNPYIIRNKP